MIQPNLMSHFVAVYVDATDVCNTAAFQLGQTAIGTTLAVRSWNIKVSDEFHSGLTNLNAKS